MIDKQRCIWCGEDPFYRQYHDTEWGVPRYDDQTLFEFLLLEGAQAGLSWITVLRKRENYRKAFANFDVQKVAAFTERDVERLMLDAGIVRTEGNRVGFRNLPLLPPSVGTPDAPIPPRGRREHPAGWVAYRHGAEGRRRRHPAWVARAALAMRT